LVSNEAEEAARFYASVFPNTRIERVNTLKSESPSGPPGSVKVVELTLLGQPVIAMSAGPFDAFNHAISFAVLCDDQAEIDRYWKAILDHGGKAEQCGWIRDKYGLCWQIIPHGMSELIKSKAASDAMMKMVKIDIAALQAAAKL